MREETRGRSWSQHAMRAVRFVGLAIVLGILALIVGGLALLLVTGVGSEIID